MEDKELQKEIDNKLFDIVEASENGIYLCMCGDSSGFEVLEATSNYIITPLRQSLFLLIHI